MWDWLPTPSPQVRYISILYKSTFITHMDINLQYISIDISHKYIHIILDQSFAYIHEYNSPINMPINSNPFPLAHQFLYTYTYTLKVTPTCRHGKTSIHHTSYIDGYISPHNNLMPYICIISCTMYSWYHTLYIHISVQVFICSPISYDLQNGI